MANPIIPGSNNDRTGTLPILRRAEREACAKECENHKVGLDSYFEIDERIQECAAAIRARSST